MDVSLDKSWKEQIKDEFDKPYFDELIQFIKLEYRNHPNSTFPKGSEIFRAFDACPFEKVKVVILGQDPYPTKGHAHGLCFSVEKDVKPLPKSLNNIFKELESDLNIARAEHGDLSRWAKQGVLLLNTVLTVSEGTPNSHSGKGWETFTDTVIQKLNQNRTGVIYFLWGSKAQRKAENVDASNNLILSAPHPSPLSAYRGFLGCKHFSKANDYLISKGEKPIAW